MNRISKYAIALCVVVLIVTIVMVSSPSSPFSAMDTGIPRLAIVAMVGLGAFIFVSIVYVYSFKSKR